MLQRKKNNYNGRLAGHLVYWFRVRISHRYKIQNFFVARSSPPLKCLLLERKGSAVLAGLSALFQHGGYFRPGKG